jgi:hypothetical protein
MSCLCSLAWIIIYEAFFIVSSSRFDDIMIFSGGRCVDQQARCTIRDTDQAARFYAMAAKQGHAKAQHNLAFCRLFGRGGDINSEEAARLFLSAAEQGLMLSQYAIGCCYMLGLGIKRDLNESGEAWLGPVALCDQRILFATQNVLTRSCLGDHNLSFLSCFLSLRCSTMVCPSGTAGI